MIKIKDFFKDNYDIIIAISALIVLSILLAYMTINNDKSARSSKPRCKCGTQNCNDSNCDPGVERIVQDSETTTVIPIEMPPSRR